MRVTKAQAQANRERIVETASELFRERGFDGVGVADLMAAAGFTHGGFYKHFGSKADLMAEASACSLSKSLASAEALDVPGFIDVYVTREHRDGRGSGCTMAALCGDAARQSDDLKATFAEGIEHTLQTLGDKYPTGTDAAPGEGRRKMIALLSRAVGALMLSRACPDDSALADEILEVCRAEMFASLPVDEGEAV
ncbi:Transcriptional regulator, AcrR family [Pseudomonas chlororaphis subsp. aurantiaca]|uniref:TetR family transcriptional regulator n=4 Tax=Pseudomonas chlororaphis TaxID=587753 RepID=A0AAQ0ATD4_9PSED|nr:MULTISPECIES: TetR family transcriptional regulator [Pseudomonas]AUG40766.1 TetR family transcriptional regulator [Pseudomonas chlororaphis]AZD21965.1 Transcriptional regulator, AcrR family [Pseudomonas chlororaphis subsp. aurantiaca]AZD35533.1 Transcriptional regulator, AcrR family [Pseudomonas chlororaphis subsp. aurantiaca]AZD41867.1 Transcriptional regulator, AcrR family [Pseudomonas chlororaphis subsp. aurantiaca]AZD48087.1 Transcriptional regulator, AcrR family [Pseudomonas chlororaph